jgi:hypothetical protein
MLLQLVVEKEGTESSVIMDTGIESERETMKLKMKRLKK